MMFDKRKNVIASPVRAWQSLTGISLSSSSSRRRGSIHFIFALVLLFLLSACTSYYEEFEDEYGYGKSSKGYELNGTTLTDLRDEHAYNVAKVGNLYWMLDNVAYKFYRNHDEEYKADCPRPSETTCKNTGFLYPGTKLDYVCPNGWRLPTYEEWEEFYNSSTFKNYTLDNDVYKGYMSGDRSLNKDGDAAYFWTNDEADGNHYRKCVSFTPESGSFQIAGPCHEQWKLAVRCVLEGGGSDESDGSSSGESQTGSITGDGYSLNDNENGVKFITVIRDFPVGHPDFENFSEEYASTGDSYYCKNHGATSGQCGELIYNTSTSLGAILYDEDWYSTYAPYHLSCGNARTKVGDWIGQDGLPSSANSMLPSYADGKTMYDTLRFGECNDKSVAGYTQRGYEKYVDGMITGPKCNGVLWSNPVYYTPGMVQPYLIFKPNSNGEFDMVEGVTIQKAVDACDNMHFDEWFAETSAQAKRSETVLTLPLTSTSEREKTYAVDYNYANGGFFPLDSVDVTTQQFVSSKNVEQWGPQSLSIYCPPYEYQYAATQADAMGRNTASLCTRWLNEGGPRGEGAAMNAASADPAIGLIHLRNFGWTMMSYAKYKFSWDKVNDAIEFITDDDLWVFVDGVLVLDRGGTKSVPAPGHIRFYDLAKAGHGCVTDKNIEWLGAPPLATLTGTGENCEGGEGPWADNTWHHIHIFHAERQSDVSVFYMNVKLQN